MEALWMTMSLSIDCCVEKEKIVVSVCCLDAASSTVCPAPQSIWPVIQIE